MILMPCVRNKVPSGEETERWEASVCPQCGKACWKPLHPRVRGGRYNLTYLCTLCADVNRRDGLKNAATVSEAAESFE